jgi:chaperonin GroES
LVGTSHAEKPVMGIVVAVADEYEQDGEDFEPLFAKGDVVLFGKFTGSRVTLDRKTYIILRENDVLARLMPDDSEDAVEGRKVKINDRGE